MYTHIYTYVFTYAYLKHNKGNSSNGKKRRQAQQGSCEVKVHRKL